MRKRTATLIAIGALSPAVAGVAFATPPSGLTSQLLARGAGGELRIHDHNTRLHLHAARPTDVAVVRATLDPGGSTGWHGHPGPSIVVVKTGTLTMYEPVHGHFGRLGTRQCAASSFGPGTAFAHQADVHNFVNKSDVVAEFYVVYLVPEAAAPLLNDVPTAPCLEGAPAA